MMSLSSLPSRITNRSAKLISSFFLVLLALNSPAVRAEEPKEKRARPQFLVHYMPWFESKSVSGNWGWHWTMGHFSPDRSDSKGRRDVASHFYPLIGPYDSADTDALEYHTLLMKAAGIDGVVVDWYGNEDFNDYGAIHRHTVALVAMLKRRGLKFAVCYEDRVLKAIAEKEKLNPAQAAEHGQAHLRFCDETWFKEPLYLTWQGKPVLLVFGPDYLQPNQWDALFSKLKRPPAFFTLHEKRGSAIGSFAWPPMWLSRNGEMDAKDLDGYFDRFYGRAEVKIASAFPGFHDIYQQAGVQPSHGHLDARKGTTFRHTLERSLASDSPFVQVATWNDFGEGTCVEPAREYAFVYLEAIQQARATFPAEPFRYRADDLRLPLRIYELRKRGNLAPEARKALDLAVEFLVAGDGSRAMKQLDKLENSPSGSPPLGGPSR